MYIIMYYSFTAVVSKGHSIATFWKMPLQKASFQPDCENVMKANANMNSSLYLNFATLLWCHILLYVTVHNKAVFSILMPEQMVKSFPVHFLCTSLITKNIFSVPGLHYRNVMVPKCIKQHSHYINMTYKSAYNALILLQSYIENNA